MFSNISSLSKLLDALSENNNIHICIHDVSGILRFDKLKISFKNHIHSRPFCDSAKSTIDGYSACIACKNKANKKAMTTKAEFSGYCVYGLKEYVSPVVIDNKVMCIVYVGNIVDNEEKLKEQINAQCIKTGADSKVLSKLAGDCQFANADYGSFAEIISSYIKLVYTSMYINKPVKSSLHHAVFSIKSYVDANYMQNITLKDLAELYFICDKYIGRLFKRQIGMTFHEYLNSVRLNEAEKMLKNSETHIIDIAESCGFVNVTYFNRVFLAKHGISPTKWRAKNCRIQY